MATKLAGSVSVRLKQYRREIVQAWILFLIILAQIGFGYAATLASAMTSIQDSLGLTNSQASAFTTTSDVGYVAGLFVFGPLGDKLGGKSMMMVALFGAGFFNFLCAFAPGYYTLILFYTLCLVFQQGKAFGMLSVSINLQWIIVGMNVGLLENNLGFEWRGIFLYSGTATLLFFVFLVFMLPGSPSDGLKPPAESYKVANEIEFTSALLDDAPEQITCSCRAIKDCRSAGNLPLRDAFVYFITSWHFWSMLISVFCFTFVFELTEWFAVFISDVIPTIPNGSGNILASMWAVGATITLLYGFVYDRLSWKWNSIILVFFSFATLATCAAMTLTFNYTWGLMLVYQLSFGFFISNPFFIPSAIYSTRFGGERYCGTLSGVYDGLGYTFSTLMDITAGPISTRWGWQAVCGICTVLSFLATVSLAFYQYIATPVQENEKKIDAKVHENIEYEEIKIN